MVEHRTAVPVVIGSNPIVPFLFFKKIIFEIFIIKKKNKFKRKEKKEKNRLRSSAVKYLLRVQVARVRFPAEPLIIKRDMNEKKRKKQSKKENNIKAL